MAINYGRDTSCTTGRRTGRLVTGTRLLAEAAFRRITTKRGTLRGGKDEKNYGIDICELVGSVESESEILALDGRIKTELSKDDRFDVVRVSHQVVEDAAALTVDFTIEGDGGAGPFRFVARVDEVLARLLPEIVS